MVVRLEDSVGESR